MVRRSKIEGVKFAKNTDTLFRNYKERTSFGLFLGKATSRTGRYYKNKSKSGKLYIRRK